MKAGDLKIPRYKKGEYENGRRKKIKNDVAATQ